MPLIRYGVVSIQSFVLGLGVLSYLPLHWWHLWGTPPDWILWTNKYAFVYPLLYLAVANILIKLLFWGKEWMVGVCGCLLGTVFGSGLLVVVLDLYHYRLFGCYIMVLSFFHYSEYLVTAATNPTTLSLDSYLLNHSVAYWLAATVSWLEYFLECWLLPSSKTFWYISLVGAVLCIFGEITRKLAMVTAQKNFNHIVQVQRQSGHKLVTHGIYSWFRHPSYVGWFWWSIGTQVLLLNPICVVAYTVTSWTFFNERVCFEEMTLISFFEQQYLDYQKKVGTGLPFIRGYSVGEG